MLSYTVCNLLGLLTPRGGPDLSGGLGAQRKLFYGPGGKSAHAPERHQEKLFYKVRSEGLVVNWVSCWFCPGNWHVQMLLSDRQKWKLVLESHHSVLHPPLCTSSCSKLTFTFCASFLSDSHGER